MKQSGFVFLLFAALASFSGCGRGGPALGQVEGTVTLDGVPLPGARVIFSPVDGGRSSMAVTDGSGHYELEFAAGSKGAVVGKHKVTISTFEAGEKDDSGQLVGFVPERVPAKYNTNTTLEVEVKRGHQVIDFPLTSR
ncbi:carboxypeptidase-like regulatory domain-containing protein [Thermogutta sp.]|uniref:carboxypeptidase-like regulatory domain-containing protein n=1 Tax=Thermogutta sp. TaxID=1962930 RepID=UPI0032203B35